MAFAWTCVDSNVSKYRRMPGARGDDPATKRNWLSWKKWSWLGEILVRLSFLTRNLKIYLEASAEERANRRSLELENGREGDYSEILASIRKRESIDSSRLIAPLHPAEDAIILNSDNKTIDTVLSEAMLLLDRKTKIGIIHKESKRLIIAWVNISLLFPPTKRSSLCVIPSWLWATPLGWFSLFAKEFRSWPKWSTWNRHYSCSKHSAGEK